jgi:hypothetical protein
MMRILFISLLFWGIVPLTNSVYAQNCVQEAQYKGGIFALDSVIGKRFYNKFYKHTSELPGCTSSILLAKFTVDSSGNIKNVSFTKIVDTIYDELLKKVIYPKSRDTIQDLVGPMMESAIRSTSGLWIPRKIDGKAVESRPFILPFLYYSEEAGCRLLATDGKPLLDNNRRQKYKKPKSTINDRLYVFFAQNFWSNKRSFPQELDCVILFPLLYQIAE